MRIKLYKPTCFSILNSSRHYNINQLSLCQAHLTEYTYYFASISFVTEIIVSNKRHPISININTRVHDGCNMWSRNCLPFRNTWFHSVFSRICVARSLVFCLVLFTSLLSFCPSSHGQCIVFLLRFVVSE